MSSKLHTHHRLGVGVHTPEEGVDSPIFGAFVHLGYDVDINGLCAETNNKFMGGDGEAGTMPTTQSTQSTPRQSCLRSYYLGVQMPVNASMVRVYLC